MSNLSPAAVAELTQREYELFRTLIYQQAGINLGPEKMQLLRARLGKVMRSGTFGSYQEYYEHVRTERSGQALTELIDAISTNTTHLFREGRHFDLLRKLCRDWAAGQQATIRIWSAACSSGEEPYSIAMTVADALPKRKPVVKILATDISNRVLDAARAGLYSEDKLGSVPAGMRRFFRRGREPGMQQVIDDVRQMITFSRFNLMTESFPFRNPFDLIFCRNVMIYFDRPTQQALVRRLSSVLRPGGCLLIGHSESLNAIDHTLEYVQPTVYRRPA